MKKFNSFKKITMFVVKYFEANFINFLIVRY
jgi:hypothetical protein